MGYLVAGKQYLKTGSSFLKTLFPLYDGHTVAWYDASVLSTFTLIDTSVSRWNDLLGSGHDLIQATGNAQPKWYSDGILFDGIDDSLKTAAFTYVQPEQIYMVAKQITWSQYDSIFDGNTNYSGNLTQDVGGSPNIALWVVGGSQIGGNPLPLNSYGIIKVLISGANSKIQVNKNGIATGNLGTGNMGGFTLGTYGGGTYSSNIKVKEIILRNIVDNTINETTIYNYLSSKYNIS
jgi:hypothetical protein